MMVGLLILLSGLFIWLLFSEKSWIADALDRMVPPSKSNQFLKNSNTYEWFAKEQILNPIIEVNRVKLDLLLGINKNKEINLVGAKTIKNFVSVFL